MRDYHVHSNFSDDCFQQPLSFACNTARSLGLKEIAFTEHIDIDYPVEKGAFQLDYEGYAEEIAKVRPLFPDLKIIRGLELGLQTGISDKMHQYLKSHEFEFVIGSVHVVDNIDLFSGEFTKEKTPEDAYRRYFEYLLACLNEYDEFHVLGHFDLIRRYGKFDKESIDNSNSEEIIIEILQHIIEKGIGLEINTSGWRYGVDDFLPGEKLLKLYRSLGGEVITFGSDAHRPEHIGFQFKEAFSLARDVGFKYYSRFKLGKPEFISIP